MRVKDHTVQCTFHPIITGFLFAVDYYWRENFGEEIVLTSGNESETRHSYTSLHYATPGQATDVRSWDITDVAGVVHTANHQLIVLIEVKELWCDHLNMPYDWIEVILENEGEEDEHFHIEYQPKRLEGV